MNLNMWLCVCDLSNWIGNMVSQLSVSCSKLHTERCLTDEWRLTIYAYGYIAHIHIQLQYDGIYVCAFRVCMFFFIFEWRKYRIRVQLEYQGFQSDISIWFGNFLKCVIIQLFTLWQKLDAIFNSWIIFKIQHFTAMLTNF